MTRDLTKEERRGRWVDVAITAADIAQGVPRDSARCALTLALLRMFPAGPLAYLAFGEECLEFIRHFDAHGQSARPRSAWVWVLDQLPPPGTHPLVRPL